jgi:protein phosphatase 1 regulatory subunit 10
MQALPPEQLQHLLAQLSQIPTTPQLQQQMHMQQQQQQQPYGDWPGLNQFSADYSQQPAFQDDGGERNGWAVGRGGRGRGRGRGRGGAGGDDGYRHNKKRLCNFFAAGRRAPNQISKTRPKTDYASVIPDANTEINATLATKCHRIDAWLGARFAVVY